MFLVTCLAHVQWEERSLSCSGPLQGNKRATMTSKLGVTQKHMESQMSVWWQAERQRRAYERTACQFASCILVKPACLLNSISVTRLVSWIYRNDFHRWIHMKHTKNFAWGLIEGQNSRSAASNEVQTYFRTVASDPPLNTAKESSAAVRASTRPTWLGKVCIKAPVLGSQTHTFPQLSPENRTFLKMKE